MELKNIYDKILVKTFRTSCNKILKSCRFGKFCGETNKKVKLFVILLQNFEKVFWQMWLQPCSSFLTLWTSLIGLVKILLMTIKNIKFELKVTYITLQESSCFSSILMVLGFFALTLVTEWLNDPSIKISNIFI